MPQTLDIVLENARNLPETDKARLVNLLLRPHGILSNGNKKQRRRQIADFQQRFAKVLPGTESYLTDKKSEIEKED